MMAKRVPRGSDLRGSLRSPDMATPAVKPVTAGKKTPKTVSSDSESGVNHKGSGWTGGASELPVKSETSDKAMANKTKSSVVQNLHYDNVEFKKSFLEILPLDDESADLVVSNCVLNLSPDKRRVFHEIYRVLKPNGRMVISDITYDGDIPLEIKYNEKLRGECIGGALRYHDLFGLLNDIGFSHSQIVKGYHYRTVKGFDFYSITYQAIKQTKDQPPTLYDFPDFEGIMATVKTEPTCAYFQAPDKKNQGPILIKRSKSNRMHGLRRRTHLF